MIICCICGTAYSDSEAKCPICGYANDTRVAVAPVSQGVTVASHKGGKFSKANVRKRNHEKQKTEKTDSGQKHARKTNIGYIVLITLLLLAILAVFSYILLRFFIPNDFLYEGLNHESVSQSTVFTEGNDTQMSAESVTQSLECTAVSIAENTVELTTVGSSYELQVVLEPSNTIDTLVFTSNNTEVASVSETGVVTAEGEGEAIITVSCGAVTTECVVICQFEEEIPVLTLNRKEITFNVEGQNWLVYNGEIPVDEIIWSSDDNNVATVMDGQITAVGEGNTVIYATYGDQEVSCVINCVFEEETPDDSDVSEATGNESETTVVDNKTYTLYNPYGRSDDVTVKPGESFILKLVDSNLNSADARWTINNPNICTYADGTVTALASGYTEIIATYAGKEYKCIVRVI